MDLEKATGGEVQVVNFGTARDAQIRLPLKGNKTSAQMSEEVMKVIHEKPRKPSCAAPNSWDLRSVKNWPPTV